MVCPDEQARKTFSNHKLFSFLFTHARTMLSVLSVSALAGMARLVVGQISENIVLSEFDAARVGTG